MHSVEGKWRFEGLLEWDVFVLYAFQVLVSLLLCKTEAGERQSHDVAERDSERVRKQQSPRDERRPLQNNG